MRGRPVDQLVYEYMFPKARSTDPQSFQSLLHRNLILEVRHEVHSYYGHLDTQEAKYPGLDYCHPIHRIRLSRWPWHRRLFRAFDGLRLTPAEIAGLTKWEGTKWAKERFERDSGREIVDSADEGIEDWVEPEDRITVQIGAVRRQEQSSQLAQFVEEAARAGVNIEVEVEVEDDPDQAMVGGDEEPSQEVEVEENDDDDDGVDDDDDDDDDQEDDDDDDDGNEDENDEGEDEEENDQEGEEEDDEDDDEDEGEGIHAGRTSHGVVASTRLAEVHAHAHAAEHVAGDDGEESEEGELQSVGVSLNERLRERAARHHAGDTSEPLDEEWEQWLKNALDSGELPFDSEQVLRQTSLLSLTPQSLFPQQYLTAARAGQWHQVPEFLHGLLRRTVDSESASLSAATPSAGSSSDAPSPDQLLSVAPSSATSRSSASPPDTTPSTNTPLPYMRQTLPRVGLIFRDGTWTTRS